MATIWPDHLLELFHRHAHQILAGQGLPVVRNLQFAGYLLGSEGMVTRDHNRANPGLPARLNRRFHLGPRRVDHAHQADEGHAAL
jgi:hypothetical protein